ncbi:Dual specificity tyrosine-phosphorylation-regulated kinase 4 [Merluccius polli]|uniref:Dual specificity tyrosine-phosphorylation-regulated kinase 4 n=1 Tax=Merluccius polli TaxID=89951 RepID=A0AA47MCT9_MERPO|nr:Dual specificity tyrosine-phosphorylation-regulated kinase 4 [Merluccius polli]
MAEVEMLELLQKNDKNDVANVVHMKEHFHFRNHLCITFDLMGKDLFTAMEERGFKGLSTSQVRSHAVPLLRSLQFLSRTGIIHCDLKPGNILVSKDDPKVIKVADFGASRLEHLNTYPVIQTMPYKSPEVVLHNAYTKAIDMWSLGCILAELKTGNALFDVDHDSVLLKQMIRVINKYQEGPRKSSRKTMRILSEILDTENKLFLNFIQRCLIYDPAKRMTPDEAIQHLWIQEHFQRPVTSCVSAPAESTSKAEQIPSGTRGSRRVGVPNKGRNAMRTFIVYETK